MATPLWISVERIGLSQDYARKSHDSVQEPGIARFDVVQQLDDPTKFVLVEDNSTLLAPLIPDNLDCCQERVIMSRNRRIEATWGCYITQ
jgi:hypothetical protein